MLIGYARVSTLHQNLAHQIGALQAAGCEVVFAEKTPTENLKGRPELEKAIGALRSGDVLIIAEWNLATRSMLDGIGIMQRVHARRAAIKVLDKPHIDLTTNIGQGFLAFISALVEDERERIARRGADGRAAARHNGVKLGRRLKLTERQLNKAREELARGKSCRAVAQDLNVHHSTISRLR